MRSRPPSSAASSRPPPTTRSPPPRRDEPPPAPRRGGPPALIETDPAIVAELIAANQASVDALKRDIQGKSGTALVDFVLDDITELKRLLFDRRSHQVFMSAM